MAVEWDKARQTARDLLARYDIVEPPVNVFDIAENEGIKVAFFKPEGLSEDVSGLLEKDKKKVYLNAAESPRRQAYTLAHELAHYFLDHNPNEYGVYRRDVSYNTKPPAEKEADMFAAELLMPAKLIGSVKRKYRLDDNDSGILAAMFMVSEPAMRFRLKSLKSNYGKEIA